MSLNTCYFWTLLLLTNDNWNALASSPIDWRGVFVLHDSWGAYGIQPFAGYETVDIQWYAGTHDVPHGQITSVVREAFGVLRLLSKPKQIQGRHRYQSNLISYWGDLVTNIIRMVPKNNFGIEEIFRDTWLWLLFYFSIAQAEGLLLNCNLQ